MKTSRQTWKWAFLSFVLFLSVAGLIRTPLAFAEDPTPVIDPPGSGENVKPSEAGFIQPAMPPDFQLGRDTSPSPEAPAYSPPADRYTILIADESLNIRLADGVRMGDALRVIDVFADGERCATVTLASSRDHKVTSGRAVEIGGPAQPEACSREGARIQFVAGNGYQLAEEFSLKIGTADLLHNFAPLPPGTGSGLTTSPLAVKGNKSWSLDSLMVRGAVGALLGGILALLVVSTPRAFKSARHASVRKR